MVSCSKRSYCSRKREAYVAGACSREECLAFLHILPIVRSRAGWQHKLPCSSAPLGCLYQAVRTREQGAGFSTSRFIKRGCFNLREQFKAAFPIQVEEGVAGSLRSTTRVLLLPPQHWSIALEDHRPIRKCNLHTKSQAINVERRQPLWFAWETTVVSCTLCHSVRPPI